MSIHFKMHPPLLALFYTLQLCTRFGDFPAGEERTGQQSGRVSDRPQALFVLSGRVRSSVGFRLSLTQSLRGGEAERLVVAVAAERFRFAARQVCFPSPTLCPLYISGSRRFPTVLYWSTQTCNRTATPVSAAFCVRCVPVVGEMFVTRRTTFPPQQLVTPRAQTRIPNVNVVCFCSTQSLVRCQRPRHYTTHTSLSLSLHRNCNSTLGGPPTHA
jgi:hypothetical protein